jgi:Transglycosylase SLT domain
MTISINNKKIIFLMVFFILFISFTKELHAATEPVDLPSWWVPGTGVVPENQNVYNGPVANPDTFNSGANWNSSPDISTFKTSPDNASQNSSVRLNDSSAIPKATVVNEPGADSATANKSSTGATTAASPADSSVQGAGTCIAGAMLAKLLTSTISSALGGVAKKTATKVLDTATAVPVVTTGEPQRTKDAVDSAHTGGFLFGVQVVPSWDSIAYCIVNTVIDYIVNSTIEWANSGFKGNPAFIRNPEQFFKQLAQREASSFIQELAYDTTGLNVCKPFRIVIATGLAGSYTRSNAYKNSCTLSQMQQNLMQSGKYTITTPTDWIALTKPQNNAYYSYISAGAEMDKRISVKNNTATIDLTLNRGFLSRKKCKDDSKPEGPKNPCDTTTPGSVIADSLSSTLNIPKDRLVSAQKFDQMVDAIVNNLIKIALSDVLTKVTGQAPSEAVASDYYSKVALNATNGTGPSMSNMPAGPSGTNGTGGKMMQDILNGATFSNADWNAYALQQIVAADLVDIPVRDAAVFFAGGTPTPQGYLSIMAAIAQRESGGQAKPARYLETKIGAGNTYSVGLMSLTPGDYGTGSLTYDGLEDPYNNIRVAVGIMGMLLRKYGVISGPPASGTPAGTGLSAYWSTFKYNN